MRAAERVRRARDLDDDHLHQVGVVAVGVDDERRDRVSFSRGGDVLARRPRAIAASSTSQRSRKSVSSTSSLESEVVVDEAVGDARLVGDVRDAAACGSPGARTRARRRRGSARRLSTAAWARRAAIRRAPRSASGRRRAAVGERGQPARGSRPGARSRGRRATTLSASGAWREHDAPRVDDHRAPAGARARARARRSGWRRRRSTGSRSRARAAAPPSGRAWWRA